MATGLLLILQVMLCYSTVTTAAVYNYHETSQEIYYYSPYILSGFRNVINKDFVIGGLFPVYNHSILASGDLEMLEAMLFAIDRINNDMSLLPNLTIGYDVRDTYNSTLYGLEEATRLIQQTGNSNPLLGIVGPASTSITLAAASRLEQIQIPLIGYGSTSATLSNKHLYEYFLRTIPSTNLQAYAMVDLISHFGWEYVSVIFNDDEYGAPGSDAFIDQAMQHNICVHVKIDILPSETNYIEFKDSIENAVQSLLKSKASVVVVFTDEPTAWALFKELNKTDSTREFIWIASDRWASSSLVHKNFPEIARGTFGFLPQHTKHIQEFDDYFSKLNDITNIRDPFFRDHAFYRKYCNISQLDGSGSGYHDDEDEYDCPDDLTKFGQNYSQNKFVPFVIDAVYAFAYALQNFLNDNCDSPVRWNHTAQHCDGMKLNLTGENLLGYLYSVAFNGIQNYSVSFDENGDPSGVYEIVTLQANDSGQYEYVTAGIWKSAHKKSTLTLNSAYAYKKIVSRCSEPCSEGMIRSITNENCPSCFECIPCVGPKYSMNSNGTNCSLCSDNHWGNNPLSGSTHCVPVEVRHLDFSSGWSITSMCIASITLIILAVITVIFVMAWNTPVVKSSGREQMVMLLIGIGACCVLTYIVVAPPSTGVCVFQRIGVWLCFSLAFGALLVKITRVARIFYSIKSSPKTLRFTDSIHQVIFTMAIVAGQLVPVAIGLGINLPAVERDPEVVITSYEQVGEAPEIIETCQQPHTAILVLLLAYNFLIIVGCTILGLMTMGFPDNFNEAKHVMFTSFTLMVIWVLFMPMYFYTEEEYQPGILALGIVLSAFALMAGVFFPRVFIIIFQKHKNTKEYVQSTGTGTIQATNFSKASQQSKTLIITILLRMIYTIIL